MLLGFGGLGTTAAIGSGPAANEIRLLDVVFLVSGLVLIVVLAKRRI